MIQPRGPNTRPHPRPPLTRRVALRRRRRKRQRKRTRQRKRVRNTGPWCRLHARASRRLRRVRAAPCRSAALAATAAATGPRCLPGARCPLDARPPAAGNSTALPARAAVARASA
eukprot:6188825-Pleurochrysis_carterae.AAC.1